MNGKFLSYFKSFSVRPERVEGLRESFQHPASLALEQLELFERFERLEQLSH